MAQPTVANDNLTAVNEGDNLTVGLPTTWGIAISQVANTGIDISNSDLAHICDFSSELIKDNKLKKFLNSQANNIRDAVRAVMRALGFSDSTGVFQWLKDSLLAIQRGLKYIQENVLQPILDFEEIAIGYIGKIKKIISYILGLPAKILAKLQDCLSNLYEAIANVFSDITGGGDSNPFKDVIDTAKSTAKTLSETVSMAAVAAGQAVAIVQVTQDIPNLVSPLKKGP